MYEKIFECAEKADSFYIYDQTKIKTQIQKLKSSFTGIEFLYSVKCNPNRNVLKTIFGSGFGADAASLGEVKMAAEAGLAKNQIYYSSPGKTKKDIKAALPISTIIADSISEVQRIAECAGDDIVKIGIRIHPDFSFDGSAVGPAKFGIEEKDALALMSGDKPANIIINGIHVHLKSQELDAERIRNYHRNLMGLIERTESALGCKLDYINMGSGIGVAYAPGDSEIDIEKLGSDTAKLIADLKITHPDTRVFIETGRYIVCESGHYVTHVADKKTSHGKSYVILQNTLNGFIRPSMAMMVQKYAGIDAASAEPFYTGKDSFEFIAPYPDRPLEKVTLVGNLCCAMDVIADSIEMAELQEDDIIIMTNAGAYAASISPMQFSSHNNIEEFMVTEDGDIIK